MDSNVTQNDGSDLSKLQVITTAAISVRLPRMIRIKDIDEQYNECLVVVLKNLTWQKLIHLRLVCKRWQTVIHSMAQQEKSLMLTLRRTGNAFVQLKNRFFEGLNLHQFVLLKEKQFDNSSDTLKHLKTLLVELFPSVEQLFINFDDSKFAFEDILSLWPAQQISTLSLYFSCDSTELPLLAAHLNSFTSLKQLGFCGHFAQILPMITPTLARLEQISWNVYNDKLSNHEVFNQLVHSLGPNCTRLLFEHFDFDSEDVGELRTIVNVEIFARLTHLNLELIDSPRVDQVLRLVCEESTCLQVLCIMYTHFDSSARLTTPTLMALSQLSHLTNLELFNIRLDFASLEKASRAGRLAPLSTVQQCTLALDIGLVNGARFSRVLSRFLPSVESLCIGLVDNAQTRRRVVFRSKFSFILEKYLKNKRSFSKLRTFSQPERYFWAEY